ncbi:Frizzy aggregation protein FrzCD [compost metagenome]
MSRKLTYGKKLAFGFTTVLVFTLFIALFAGLTLQRVVTLKDGVISDNIGRLMVAEKMSTSLSDRMAFSRGYLLSAEKAQLEKTQLAREDFLSAYRELSQRAPDQGDELREMVALEEKHWQAASRIMQDRQNGASIESVSRRFEQELSPLATSTHRFLSEYIAKERAAIETKRVSTNQQADQAVLTLMVLAGASILLAVGVAIFLIRSLTRQIQTAIGQLQVSSTELQAAANQQAAGSGEQAATVTEVSTTMRELLASSRQITENAQRVARTAEETAASARSGELSVTHAQHAVENIRRQVDTIVTHMLDLGRKSQQIGGILEIIKELAEQTNILAINATIEAAGAGEHGKRFAAVAEEIRKLADRVGGSTGDIRHLIEEIRASANSTVMATEDGSKAVDVGMRQFSELATAFRQIVDLVADTAESVREIELGTKQQTTAVEQVNLAIADVAQAAKETEASSRKTLQTSSELAGLSRELAVLVEAQR